MRAKWLLSFALFNHHLQSFILCSIEKHPLNADVQHFISLQSWHMVYGSLPDFISALVFWHKVPGPLIKAYLVNTGFRKYSIYWYWYCPSEYYVRSQECKTHFLFEHCQKKDCSSDVSGRWVEPGWKTFQGSAVCHQQALCLCNCAFVQCIVFVQLCNCAFVQALCLCNSTLRWEVSNSCNMSHQSPHT